MKNYTGHTTRVIGPNPDPRRMPNVDPALIEESVKCIYKFLANGFRCLSKASRKHRRRNGKWS